MCNEIAKERKQENSFVIMSLVLAGEEAHPPSLDRADAVVEVIMRALTP
jgi:hypothetical protein